MSKEVINYNGFSIIRDELLGYSLIDRFENWSMSSSSIEEIKKIIDKIIEDETKQTQV